MRLARDDNSLITEWWLTIDRVLLAALLTLVVLGVVLSMAASPALAIRKGLPTFYFVERHVVFASAAVVVVVVVSMLEPRGLRRLSLAALAVGLALMALAIIAGPEIKGARRWVFILGQSLQPSEVAKPGFVVLAAWALSEAQRRKDVPAIPVALGLYLAMMVALILQPDVGQSVLVTLSFGAMMFLSGLPVAGVASFAGLAALAGGAAYLSFSHVQQRVERFLWPSGPEGFQSSKALQSFIEGGMFGKGPGEGTLKTYLPDAHTDYVLAVLGEEYGIIACLGLLMLFAFITFRALTRSARLQDPFMRLASAGLAVLLTFQVLIHAAVNVALLPAKGMTLPFISTGGSSMLGLAFTTGMLVALTRRRPSAFSSRADGPDVREAALVSHSAASR